MRKRILLDIDGVIADFVTPVVRYINELTGYDYKNEDVTEWDIAKCLKLAPRQSSQLDEYIRTENFCLMLSGYAGADEALGGLRELADVYAVTAPFKNSPFWMPERARWLADRAGFDLNKVVFASEKQVCAGDVLIDDKCSTLVTWMQHHPKKRTVLLNQTWNKGDAAPDSRADLKNLVATVRNALETW